MFKPGDAVMYDVSKGEPGNKSWKCISHYRTTTFKVDTSISSAICNTCGGNVFVNETYFKIASYIKLKANENTKV